MCLLLVGCTQHAHIHVHVRASCPSLSYFPGECLVSLRKIAKRFLANVVCSDKFHLQVLYKFLQYVCDCGYYIL